MIVYSLLVLNVFYWSLDTLESNYDLKIIKYKLFIGKILISVIIISWILLFSSMIKNRNEKPSNKSYCLVLFMSYITLVFVQKPIGGSILAIGFLRVLLLIYYWNNQVENYFEQSFIIYILGMQIFFNTGHQSVFSTIHLIKVGLFLRLMFGIYIL